MRSTLSRLPLLASLSLLLLSTACATTSTILPSERTDRPTLPTLNPDLVRTERVPLLTAQPSGILVTIDKAILEEMQAQHAQLLGAVTRANNRAAGVKKERRCIRSIFETGKPGPDCPVQ